MGKTFLSHDTFSFLKFRKKCYLISVDFVWFLTITYKYSPSSINSMTDSFKLYFIRFAPLKIECFFLRTFQKDLCGRKNCFRFLNNIFNQMINIPISFFEHIKNRFVFCSSFPDAIIRFNNYCIDNFIQSKHPFGCLFVPFVTFKWKGRGNNCNYLSTDQRQL